MKKNRKVIMAFILGIIVTGTIVYAESVISGSQVSYEDHVGLGSTNVQGAIDKIYEKINTKLCKRATTLHNDGTHTFGRLGTGNNLTSGDAFDCDVNGDGTYNAETERFYYVTDLDINTAVLIYYNNTINGSPDNTRTSSIAYDESSGNYHGPRTAVENLPTTSQWKTRVYSNPRQIYTETGTTSTTGGDLPTFIYSAARLITYQEVASVCPNLTTVGGLKPCNYLMENTSYSSNSDRTQGYWLESPYASYSYRVWRVYGDPRSINYISASYAYDYGVRPVIEVPKVDIEI